MYFELLDAKKKLSMIIEFFFLIKLEIRDIILLNKYIIKYMQTRKYNDLKLYDIYISSCSKK